MIGVIADDLTGAAELGAVGLRHGLRAEVLILRQEFRIKSARGNQPAEAGTPCTPDLICVTTESRSLSPRRAALRATAGARWLRNAGAKWVYKKTDSVLRGQVTAELEAIMKELCCRRTLLLPANPSLGRTIRDGRYFIGGKLIHRTDFARDPEHPRRSANVREMLAESEVAPVRVLRHVGECSPAGIFIGEVSSTADVERWVACYKPDMLLAGGADTFGAVLTSRREKLHSKRAGRNARAPRGSELFVCGSASVTCRGFVNQSRRQAVPIIGLPAEFARRCVLPRSAKEALMAQLHAALRANRRVILHVGLPLIRERAVARRLTKHLVELAATALSDGQIGHVFAEGGETAAALLRRLGWARLKVLREVAPGVVTLEPKGGEGVWLTIKPGSYPWSDAILKPSRGGR